MRFSLKWILAGMVYVAIAAAAFTEAQWYYVDALWTLTLLAVIYALLTSAFARGNGQIQAVGFVAGSVSFALCIALGGDAVPTARLLNAAGYYPVQSVGNGVSSVIATTESGSGRLLCSLRKPE